jgi:hypothetical protein
MVDKVALGQFGSLLLVVSAPKKLHSLICYEGLGCRPILNAAPRDSILSHLTINMRASQLNSASYFFTSGRYVAAYGNLYSSTSE